MKEPKVIPRILEILQTGAETTAEIFDVFTSGYSSSYRKARAYALGRREIRFKTNWAESYREWQRFYSLLNKLKREGLIRKEGKNQISRWYITRTGLIKLKKIQKLKEEKELLNDGVLRIVTFDIPEKEKIKREWIRLALKNNNFKILHKSVWIGKRKLPEKFFLELRQRKMIDYVHIFEITKTGTLREVV